MKSILIAALGLLLYAFTANDQLTGTWQPVRANNRRMIFKADSSFDMLVNNMTRLSGTYSLANNLFTIDDPGCPDMTGTYKVTFFGNGDSCRFEVINDACDDRRYHANGTVLFRVP